MIGLHPAQADFFKRLVRLKMSANDFFVYGRMLRPPQWIEAPPVVRVENWNMQHLGTRAFDYDVVECSLWEAADGRRALFVVNYDDEPHAVVLDAGAVVGSAPRAATIITAEGERPWRDISPEDTIGLDAPAADAVMIVLE